MIILNERVDNGVSRETLERLRAIPPATIGHMLDFGFMDVAIRPIGKRVSLCGPAVTVRCMAIDGAVVYAAIEAARPGDVIVVDRNGDTMHAPWGEMTSLFAQARGVAGAVVDGAVTDIVEIEELRFPVFARGVSPITTKALAVSGEVNTTVQCGGVVVRPGDIIHGDDNGLLVLPPEILDEVIARCEPRARREPEWRERLRAGESLLDLTGARQKLANAEREARNAE